MRPAAENPAVNMHRSWWSPFATPLFVAVLTNLSYV
jgi:hypothetical protein